MVWRKMSRRFIKQDWGEEKNYLYLDNSNVRIEGNHSAAVEGGKAYDIGTALGMNLYSDDAYDFGKLLKFAGGSEAEVEQAVRFGSMPSRDDTIWEIAKQAEFEVVVEDKNTWIKKEKKIYTGITTMITDDVCKRIKNGDTMTLVAGGRR